MLVCYIPINAELVYLSRAVFAFTAITHSSPQDFRTVHWKQEKIHHLIKVHKTRFKLRISWEHH